MKRKVQLLLLLLILSTSLSVGCRHNTNVANPTTPFQQVLLWNKGLSEANQDLEKSVQALNATIPPVIDNATTKNILTAQFKIFKADKALTQILEQGPEYTSGKAAQVNDLIKDINSAATDLVNTGTVGIKNHDKQVEISGLITAISGLGQTIVTGLQAAGVLK